MKPFAFVVVYNLLVSDLSNDLLLAEIEKIVVASINSRWPNTVTEHNVIFSFPTDPSVITPAIPVVCDVILLDTKSFLIGDKYKRDIGEKIKKGLLSKLKERNEMLVLIRDDVKSNVLFIST